MSLQQSELAQLQEDILNMMKLAKKQVSKAKDAMLNFDSDLAEEVIYKEARMNAEELNIERQCANLCALYNPVATDLRFVLSMQKVNLELERIGDHAESLVRYVLNFDKPFNPEILKLLGIEEMFNISLSMLDDIIDGFKDQDVKIARKVFKKDHSLDAYDHKAVESITHFVKSNPDSVKECLFLYGAVRNLERVGDLSTDMAENIVFHLDAEVLKHKKTTKAQ